MIMVRTFLSGFAISGKILQNGLITSKNFTVIQTKAENILIKTIAMHEYFD